MTDFAEIPNSVVLLYLYRLKSDPYITPQKLKKEVFKQHFDSNNAIDDYIAKRIDLTASKRAHLAFEMKYQAMQDTIEEEGYEHYE